MCTHFVSDLRPLRIPLQSKKSKRCPSCRHILIKPEQKAQSVRFKIKLVAANYLPAIAVSLPHAQAALEMVKRASTKAASAAQAAEEQQAAGALIAGHSYSFHLAFTNPLYDPIQVRLAKATAAPAPGAGSAEPERTRRNTFQIQLPSAAFPVGAYAEAWEYDDEDEDMFLDDDDGMELVGDRGKKGRDGRGKARSVGIVEKRANVTIVSGEVLIPKEARGDVKVGGARACGAFAGSAVALAMVRPADEGCWTVQHARLVHLPVRRPGAGGRSGRDALSDARNEQRARDEELLVLHSRRPGHDHVSRGTAAECGAVAPYSALAIGGVVYGAIVDATLRKQGPTGVFGLVLWFVHDDEGVIISM